MEKLKIYNESLLLVKDVYILTFKNSKLKLDRSLCDQIRRAVVSIPANIAEGYMRSGKQFKNYLKIASGSENEVVSLLQVITMVYGINTNELQEKLRILGRKIIAFSKTF